MAEAKPFVICLCGFVSTFMVFPPTPGGGRPCRIHPLSGPAARRPRKVLKSCSLAGGVFSGRCSSLAAKLPDFRRAAGPSTTVLVLLSLYFGRASAPAGLRCRAPPAAEPCIPPPPPAVALLLAVPPSRILGVPALRAQLRWPDAFHPPADPLWPAACSIHGAAIHCGARAVPGIRNRLARAPGHHRPIRSDQPLALFPVLQDVATPDPSRASAAGCPELRVTPGGPAPPTSTPPPAPLTAAAA